MQILKVSPQGQVTIPKQFRNLSKTGAFAAEISGRTIVLRPIKIEIVKDDLGDVSHLSEKAFEFWDNEEDDVYGEFYKDK
ncbi:hypothetical protein HYW82_02455 [Candidatus Peregrinibacteria bacterium]|nr:hypothetical protein [Candidatus Peregrinibacteria bacterium]